MKTAIVLIVIALAIGGTAWYMETVPSHVSLPSPGPPPSAVPDIRDPAVPLVRPGQTGTVPLVAKQISRSAVGVWQITGPQNAVSDAAAGWRVSLGAKAGGVWQADVTAPVSAFAGRYSVIVQPPPATGPSYSADFDVP